ncbi:MAG: hypothetical protein HYT07_01545 [Candidatus Levybacteria bacterium]|nr:hypothetical protein [Candidatus Levybacteria bacterium]
MITRSHYKHLSEKWRKRHLELQKELWSKHKKSLDWLSRNSRQLVAGSLGGLMLLSSSTFDIPQSIINTSNASESSHPNIDKKSFLISDLSNVLPKDIRPLTLDEERKVSEILTRTFGVKVTGEMQGKSLNRSYGLIGQEQHLSRYPGDTLYSHFDSEEEAKNYWSQGMAPGRGAWGYFSHSKESLTEEDKLREKYYIAVQTFLAPGFYNNVKEYVDFFKYRKMLVVNPNNGMSIVTDIADAGPAEWTGKHLGGSPEVMRYLERVDGALKGGVLYFFIDDPNDNIPLGPIKPV